VDHARTGWRDARLMGGSHFLFVVHA